LAACSAIARSGERCKGVAIDGSGLCYAHHPDHAGARRRAARKGGKRGGRGRPVAEISELKHRFEELAEDVLDGKVDRADAAIVGQLWNYAVRSVAVGLKAREQQELEARLEQLEALLEQRDEARGWG
jgi:hypothetical protein